MPFIPGVFYLIQRQEPLIPEILEHRFYKWESMLRDICMDISKGCKIFWRRKRLLLVSQKECLWAIFCALFIVDRRFEEYKKGTILRIFPQEIRVLDRLVNAVIDTARDPERARQDLEVSGINELIARAKDQAGKEPRSEARVEEGARDKGQARETVDSSLKPAGMTEEVKSAGMTEGEKASSIVSPVSLTLSQVSTAAETDFDHLAFPDRDQVLDRTQWDAARDVIVVLGNPLAGYPQHVVDALKELDLPGKVLFVGKGTGAVAEWQSVSEAVLKLDLKNELKLVDENRMLWDSADASMNTGANIETVLAILNREGITPRNVVLIHAPQSLLVSKRIFEKQWTEKEVKDGDKIIIPADSIPQPQSYTYALPSYIEQVKESL